MSDIEIAEVVGNDEAAGRRLAFNFVLNAEAVEDALAGGLKPVGAPFQGDRAAQADEPERRTQRARAKASATARRAARRFMGQRSEEVISRGRRKQFEIEQGEEVDGAEFAVPGRRRADTRANGKVGSEQLGNLGQRWQQGILNRRATAVRLRSSARWDRQTPR